MMEMEKIILKELGYETFRLLDLPHKFLPTYVRSFKVTNELARLAWSFLNDSFRLPLVVFYPANDIAVSCLYLAMRKLEFTMPDIPWWTVCGTSLKHVQEICAEILNIYNIQTNKLFLEDVKSLVESNFKKKFSEYKYYEPFQEETQPRVDFRSASNNVPEPEINSGEADDQNKPPKPLPFIDPDRPRRRIRRSRSRSLDRSRSRDRKRSAVIVRRDFRRSRSRSRRRRAAENRRTSRRDRRVSRSVSSRSRRARRSREKEENRGARKDAEKGETNQNSRNRRERRDLNDERNGKDLEKKRDGKSNGEQDIEAQIVADEEENNTSKRSPKSGQEDERANDQETANER